MEANKTLSSEPLADCSGLLELKTMKCLLLTLPVFLVLFQMFPGNRTEAERQEI
jgi:hypothetical protein